MRPVTAALAACLALSLLACGPARTGVGPDPAGLGSAPTGDADYELSDDLDLASVRARYEAMPADPISGERQALRQTLAAEYARRIDHTLHGRPRAAAYDALVQLLSLWRPADLADPDAVAELARFRPQVQAVRDAFARAGADRETTVALVALAVVDPERAAEHRAELTELFAFADELAVARFGAGAERARPIELLEGAVLALPTDAAVDQLVELLITRQAALQRHFSQKGADFNLVRAHGESVLRTAWSVVRMLARAERLADAPAKVAAVDGIGKDEDLAAHLRAALAAEAGPADWVVLAANLRGADPAKSDPTAALRILEEGLRRFPDSAMLHATIGQVARELENLPRAIAAYERAYELEPSLELAEPLAELYEIRVAELVFRERPNAGRRHLAALEDFHRRARSRYPGQRLSPDLASAYGSMGRGLVSLGQLDEARRYLGKSVELRPTYAALESLGTVALKQQDFAAAATVLARALALPDRTVNDHVARAKILRLLGDARAGEGKRDEARRHWRAGLEAWETLLARYGQRLIEEVQGEALTETGQLHWKLGDTDAAVRAVEDAVDADPDGASTHATAVSFFITHGDYERALDTFHRALGSEDIGAYFKVYMSLWIIAEGRRLGRPVDSLAADYLAERDGRLWYDDLARYATGRVDFARVRARATTRARRAELLYYVAVLSEATEDPRRIRRLLEQVIATDMVLFFEYDMARHWLTSGFRPAAAAAAD